MIDTAQARQIARTKLAAKLARWATEVYEIPLLSVPLKPPVEREVRADEHAVENWVREWAGARLPPGAELDWESRTWRTIGRQQVPVRLRLRDAAAVAAFAGGAAARDWAVLSDRVAALRAAHHASTELDAVIRRHAAEITGWQPDRFAQVVEASQWLATRSVSGLRPRQLPIRGVDTKWFASHFSVLTALHTAVTGSADLGIVRADRAVRLRFLDAALAPGGLTDLAAPAPQLAGLAIEPRVVFVFENLESVLAMPRWPGAVVVHGDGYAVDALGCLPWLVRAPVVYWGDLDSHGFGILHRLRAHLPSAVSVLMDEQTLMDHRDLWVRDPKPTRAALSLHPSEQAALERLRLEGDVKLEQERIPWRLSLARLAAVAPEAPIIDGKGS